MRSRPRPRRPAPRPPARPAKPIPNGDSIPARYEGKPGVLLATGPSLSSEDIEYIRPLHARGEISVFGLNDAYKLCDFLDVFYFCDPRWLASNPSALDYSHGEIWSQDTKVRQQHDGKIKRCAGTSGTGLCREINKIHFGGNSGFQLLNLAWHFGIRDFYLLGYNMGVSDKGQATQHFFGQHPKPLNQSNNYKGFVSGFRAIDKETRAMITNCTYPTALTGVFEQRPLREALPHNEKTRHIPDEPATREAARPCEAPAKIKAVSGNGRRTNMEEQDSGDHSDREEPIRRAVEPDPLPAYGG